MNELIQIFIDHIPYDKQYVKVLLPRYEHEFELLGGYLKKHSTSLSCKDIPELEELLDFIDGNGFEVTREEPIFPWDDHPIGIKPIYVEKEENENGFEKLQQAIEKVQSALSNYIPVQETVLSYTSMEDDQRDLLEYSQLLASWAFWLRVCRRVELLRLVPKGRCGSTSVPRPP